MKKILFLMAIALSATIFSGCKQSDDAESKDEKTTYNIASINIKNPKYIYINEKTHSFYETSRQGGDFEINLLDKTGNVSPIKIGQIVKINNKLALLQTQKTTIEGTSVNPQIALASIETGKLTLCHFSIPNDPINIDPKNVSYTDDGFIYINCLYPNNGGLFQIDSKTGIIKNILPDNPLHFASALPLGNGYFLMDKTTLLSPNGRIKKVETNGLIFYLKGKIYEQRINSIYSLTANNGELNENKITEFSYNEEGYESNPIIPINFDGIHFTDKYPDRQNPYTEKTMFWSENKNRNGEFDNVYEFDGHTFVKTFHLIPHSIMNLILLRKENVDGGILNATTNKKKNTVTKTFINLENNLITTSVVKLNNIDQIYDCQILKIDFDKNIYLEITTQDMKIIHEHITPDNKVEIADLPDASTKSNIIVFNDLD